MADISVDLCNVIGVSITTAREYLEAVDGSLQNACFLHYCVSGKDPDLYPVFFGKALAPSPEFKVTMRGYQPASALSPKEITQWEELAFESLSSSAEPEACSICLCAFEASDSGEIVRLGKCKAHYFHKVCITPACSQGEGMKCPVCGVAYGVQIGPMPAGTLELEFNSQVTCAGSQPGSWILTYRFPNGKLPNGTKYSGTRRQAVVPDEGEGPEVMRLLVCAFYRRFTFAVGTSVTTGAQNTVVWNGIHHKTSTEGGPTNFGYPDDGYFSRVKSELAARGIAY